LIPALLAGIASVVMHAKDRTGMRLKRFLFLEHHVCPWWLCFAFDNPLRRLVHDPVRILGDFVRPGQTVLDVGLAWGIFRFPWQGSWAETDVSSLRTCSRECSTG
jgi:hypothetical protein